MLQSLLLSSLLMVPASDTPPEELSSRQRTQLLAGLVGTGTTMIVLSPAFIIPAKRRLDRLIDMNHPYLSYSCNGNIDPFCRERVLIGINRLGGAGVAFAGIGAGFTIAGVSTLAKSLKLRRSLYISEMAVGGTLFIAGGAWALATWEATNPFYFTAVASGHDFETKEWADRYKRRRLGHGIIGASMASVGVGLLTGSAIAYIVEKYAPKLPRMKRVAWQQGPQFTANYIGFSMNGRF